MPSISPSAGRMRFQDSRQHELYRGRRQFRKGGHTAWQCMIVQGQVKPWDDVLVHAAGSGVASMGIQIARMVGARVFVTAGSDWKLARARELLGVAEGINYRETPKVSERIMELTDGKGRGHGV